MTDGEMEFALSLMGSEFAKSGNQRNRSAHCPLANWTHNRGKDKRPSLMARAGDPALFKCWACQEKGSFKTLSKKYAEYSGDWRAYNYVISIEGGKKNYWQPSVKPYGKPMFKKQTEEVAKEITEEDLAKRYLEEVPNYAYDRGCTPEQILKWELGYDAYEKRMIFPVRDHRGKLMGVSGRDLTGLDDRSKYKHYFGFKKELFLYGERFWDPANKRAFICEGFFDVLNMERHGLKNVFAPFGTGLSWDQMKKLRDWFDEIIFLPDANDVGQGLEFAEKSCLRLLPLKKRVKIAGVTANPCFIHRLNPPRWEASDNRFQLMDYFKGKDPGDWTAADLKVAFENVGVLGLNGGIEISFERLEIDPAKK